MRRAAVCFALAAAVYLAAVHVPLLAQADLRTLSGFMGLWGFPGSSLSLDLIGLFDPAPFAILSGSLVVGALVARRFREGAVALVAMLGAGITTQVLKPLLAVQRDFPFMHYMGPEAYPSGHTTAVMSLALALVIVSPLRWRPLAAAAGGVLTVATVYSILLVGGHYPSDVIGGFLVATGWACLASSVLQLEARDSVAGPALGAAVLAGVALLAVAWRPEGALAYAAANTTWVLGALAIAAGALVLSGSVPVPRAAPPRHSPRARG
jgi:membrane-associated phospholipid phosphatase